MSTKKKVFSPTKYEVRIGGTDYILEPQPIAIVADFDSTIRELEEDFGSFGDRHYVVQYGEEGEELSRSGPYSSALADDELTRQKKADPEGRFVIDITPYPVADMLKSISKAPYPILKTMIPDLTEEDSAQIRFPELEFLIKLLVEVNGLEWLEKLVKNLLGPLMEQAGEIAKGAVTESSRANTGQRSTG